MNWRAKSCWSVFFDIKRLLASCAESPEGSSCFICAWLGLKLAYSLTKREQNKQKPVKESRNCTSNIVCACSFRWGRKKKNRVGILSVHRIHRDRDIYRRSCVSPRSKSALRFCLVGNQFFYIPLREDGLLEQLELSTCDVRYHPKLSVQDEV